MPMLRNLFRLFVFPLALFAASAVLLAQSDSAVLFGLVTDPSGSSIRGATVVLRNNGTGATRQYATDDRGLFYFTLLPPGSYSISAEAAGFKQYRDPAVRVQVAQVARLDLELEIGSTKEIVNISDQPSGLNTENVSQGTVVGSEKIPALPLNGRQFIQLALLVPGANPGGRTVQQNTIRQGQIGGLSIAGARTNNTLFLVDGAANTDPDYSSLNYSPNVDTINEFQVQTAMVGAEYSRAAVNLVTKSGTNQPHATLWEFLRNKDFDARPFNYLQSDLPKFQRNQFGATFGGPIKHDKLFAFVSYEGLRVNQAAANLTTVQVPTALQRTGDFSVSNPKGITDPTTKTLFTGGKIPAARINPLVLAAASAMPLPNDPTGKFFTNNNELLTQDNNNYSGRLDWVAKQNWNVFGRYSISDENAQIPAAVTDRIGLNNARSQHAVIGSTKVLSANLLNETRIGLSRLYILTGLPELNFSVDGQQRALPQFIATPYPNFGGAGGFAGTTGGGIVRVRDTSYQLYDNLAWTKGRHQFKFGGEADRLDYNRYESANVLGSYTFTAAYTGDALASAMLSAPSIAARSIGPSRIDGRQWSYAAYAQDDFRLGKNVTLNLGVRYEIAPPMYDIHQQMSSIDYSKVPTPGDIFASGKTGFYKPTLFICGQSGYPKGCAYTDKNNFAPRAGIVWAASPKTVVRVGSGMFYAANDLNPLFRLAAGLPGNIAQTVNNDTGTPRFYGFDVFGPAVVTPNQVAIQAAGIDLYQRTSYMIQWNASVQHEIAKDIVLETGYLASLGLKLEQNVQPNNALPGTAAIDPRRPYAGVVYAPGTQFPSYITVQGDSVPVTFINYLPHSAQSNYHSLFVRFEKRYTHGLSFLSSYTFSKAITNAPQFRNAGGANGNENSPSQDSFNLAADRGLASFNVAHRSVTTAVYELPFGKDKAFLQDGFGSKLLGGWSLSGIYSIQTGFPYTVNIQGDSAGVGAGTGGIFVRPNAVPGQSWDLPSSQRTTDKYFNTAAFSFPGNGRFGNVGKNTLIGPGLTDFDAVISKSILIREGLKLELRGEAFNIFNHSNYTYIGRLMSPAATNTIATFGKVLGQLDPRQIQLGAKLLF
jgi:outer membrane receptor protein involved in Fe transport